jgi:hypothetical protein
MYVEDYYTSPVWVTKEGKELNISEMGTSHIQNCIKMNELKFQQRLL